MADALLQLLEKIGRSRPITSRLRGLGKKPLTLSPAHPASWSLLAALIAKKTERLWVITADLRTQERVHHELLNWEGEALFLPEGEGKLPENALPDPELNAERLQTLSRIRSEERCLIVTTAGGLEADAPAPGKMDSLSLPLRRGEEIALDHLSQRLADAGYERVPQVALRGQFAIRGGIVDLFSWQHTLPLRIEFFGDEIESLRHFDLDAQTAVQPLEAVEILLGEAEGQACVRDYLRPGDLLLNLDAGLEEQAAVTISAEGEGEPLFDDHGLGVFEAGDLVIEAGKRQQFFRQLDQWLEEKWEVHLLCNNEGERERFHDLLPHPDHPRLHLAIGSINTGFLYPKGKIAILCDAELFGRYRNTRARRQAMRRAQEHARRSQIDFSELVEDDIVVHLEHGIARFEELTTFAKPDGSEEEVLVLEFARGAKLYVPLEQAYLVSRYVGVGKRNPELSELGDARWSRAKAQAQKAVFDYAASLLSLHAERESAPGHSFPPDTAWQGEFERSFLYRETPDQLTAITQTKADMESPRPMDRLICGDVGFGKTEVAIRAAFKAVTGGRQVAVLVPTTVLAQQHYQNFRERMSDYPIRVETLSRFRTAAQQREVLEGMADGSVDIVVGTHRLISKDVRFKDLGLVVIDEEQRFGVVHKERFKELFKRVDVLTLSATPIPRTLYLSLMGARDMSILETPPQNRVPTETIICGYDERVIRDAIRQELARQGQVFFLHNRVASIEGMRTKLRQLVPKARIVVGHGQMDEHELEAVMQQFIEGKADVLLSTTIIESGLDIPNANTIIIDRADRFGLADLYQLRGRVGRAQQKAYAYLMIPRDLMAGEARKRIAAIRQYSSLGAGFKIAMRDLEIRGAGNILGTQQSGHIVAIGFDLYCQLLKQAVAKLKGEKVHPRVELPVRLDFLATSEADFLRAEPGSVAPAFLPAAFISEARTRIAAYRALAEVTTSEGVEALRREWRDRFGRFPEAVENLLLLAEIRLAAAARKITRLEVRERKLMLTRRDDYLMIGGKFPRLHAPTPTGQLEELLSLIRKF